MRPPSIRFATAARLAFGVIAIASGVAAVAVALLTPNIEAPGRLTTYADHSSVLATLTVAAGAALVTAGLVIGITGRPGRIGDLLLLAGLLWFAPVWVGWERGPALVRSLGTVAAGFTVPLILHAALAYPDGRLQSAVGRVVVGAAYVASLLAALGLAVLRDPFFDPNCWANCTDNVFLVRSIPGLARTIEWADRWFTGAATAAFVALYLARLARGSMPTRRALLPVALPAVLFAGAVTARPFALQRAPREDPSDPVFLAIFVVTSTAVTLFGAGLVWASVRTRLQRRAVAQIATRLAEAPRPGTLESALGRAIGDPQLRIAYWLENTQSYVDASGQPVSEPVPAPTRAITALVRDNRRIAVVSYAAGLPEIEPQIGPAVRLALENERLQAEALAHLGELRASRSRIVETGDAERRRLERDLHDGAQQRLLAASYEIRLARSSAQIEGDAETGLLLAQALDKAQDALAELRSLAHGIYPAILEEAGLAAALASFADAAALPVEISGVAEKRYPAPVETAVYLLVVEAVADAATRDASYVTVNVSDVGDQLLVTVKDDGTERTSAMVQLADRVGALGGGLEVGSMVLRAKVPCA